MTGHDRARLVLGAGRGHPPPASSALVAAGIATPFVWRFAAVFYRYRQWRWRTLVENDSAY